MLQALEEIEADGGSLTFDSDLDLGAEKGPQTATEQPELDAPTDD